MAQGRSTKIITMIEWIRTSRLSIKNSLSLMLGCISPQDDATVKCWGFNLLGQLGVGDTSNRGYNANGPCPPSSTPASLLPAPRVLTLVPALMLSLQSFLRKGVSLGYGGRN